MIDYIKKHIKTQFSSYFITIIVVALSTYLNVQNTISFKKELISQHQETLKGTLTNHILYMNKLRKDVSNSSEKLVLRTLIKSIRKDKKSEQLTQNIQDWLSILNYKLSHNHAVSLSNSEQLLKAKNNILFQIVNYNSNIVAYNDYIQSKFVKLISFNKTYQSLDPIENSNINVSNYVIVY